MSEQCAYHEAGHATMAHFFGAKVESVSIDPEWDDDSLRHDGEVYIAWDNVSLNRSELLLAQIRVALAGPAAEMIHTCEPFHPAFVREWCLDWEIAWELAAQEHPAAQQRLAFLEKTTVEVYRFLSQDSVWQALASLVDLLLAHEYLEGNEVHETLATWM